MLHDGYTKLHAQQLSVFHYSYRRTSDNSFIVLSYQPSIQQENITLRSAVDSSQYTVKIDHAVGYFLWPAKQPNRHTVT